MRSYPIQDYQIDQNNVRIKRIKRSTKWNYVITSIHLALVIFNLPPIISMAEMNKWHGIAAMCWGICVVIDVFKHFSNKKSIIKLEKENLDLLKIADHDEWIKVTRRKKLSRITS